MIWDQIKAWSRFLVTFHQKDCYKIHIRNYHDGIKVGSCHLKTPSPKARVSIPSRLISENRVKLLRHPRVLFLSPCDKRRADALWHEERPRLSQNWADVGVEIIKMGPNIYGELMGRKRRVRKIHQYLHRRPPFSLRRCCAQKKRKNRRRAPEAATRKIEIRFVIYLCICNSSGP